MRDFPINKALTLRASSIGDTLMGKYFLENIHAHAPQARCTLLVGSRYTMIRDLLAGYPWITVVAVNRRHPLKLLRTAQELYGQDLTLTQYAERPFSLPSKLFARFVTKRGGLLGFTDSFWGNRFIYDTVMPFAGEAQSEGMIVEEQRALKAAGVPVLKPDLTLSYPEDRGVCERFGLTQRQYVIAHLFSGNEGRSISQERRVEIVCALRAALPASYSLVLTGVTEEHGRARACQGELQGVMTLAGRTTVPELINLLGSARVVLGLDSGAAHIAAHLRVPLVVMTRTESKQSWWSSAMYGGRPAVLSNDQADDLLPRASPHPPSLETIDITQILAKVIDLLPGS